LNGLPFLALGSSFDSRRWRRSNYLGDARRARLHLNAHPAHVATSVEHGFARQIGHYAHYFRFLLSELAHPHILHG
jgi:hypothetical protein